MKSRTSLIALMTALAGCVETDEKPLNFEVDGERFVVSGVVDGDAPETFQRMRNANPKVRTLILKDVPGSANDEANLKLARAVRQGGFVTLVPADGLVASGGTDLFIAGKTRIVAPGACLGVHSWAGGWLWWTLVGNKLPNHHDAHKPYLEYYKEMGIDSAFYWFTLRAASPEDIHWMSDAEINKFKLSTTTILRRQDEAQQRCNQRL